MVEEERHDVGDRRSWVPDEPDRGQVRIARVEHVEPIGHARYRIAIEAQIVKIEEYGHYQIRSKGKKEDTPSLGEEATDDASTPPLSPSQSGIRGLVGFR